MLLLSFFILLTIVSICTCIPCTKDDYFGEYTVCRETSTGPQRDALFRWKPTKTCNENESGSVTLPGNVFDLPCDRSCDEGHYLPVGETQCQECQPGTVSVGGGILVSHWQQWPEQLHFTTRCERNHNKLYEPGDIANCQGWQLGSWNVKSGNISSLESSVLELRVSLVRDGKIDFHYFVSAEEGFDGLAFFIDNADQHVHSKDVQDEVALPLVSNTPTLANFSAPLKAGLHTLTWKYFKDFASEDGNDQAYIKNLLITGLSYADEQCHKCPAGTFAAGTASTKCLLCGEDKYSNTPGAQECQSCDVQHEYAYPGSTKCETRPPCTINDYEAEHEDCGTGNQPQTRLVKYKWLLPKICDSSTGVGVSLPAETSVACAPCPGGYRRGGSSAICVPCAPGEAGGGDTNAECLPCGAGQAAQPVVQLDQEFDRWPKEVATRCSGDCATAGWRLTGKNIDSGVGHGDDVEVTLEWPVMIESLDPTPYVEFTYSLECEGGFDEECDLEFSVVGNYSHTYYFGHERTVKVDFIRTGQHDLEWVFSKSSGDDMVSRLSRAEIHSINIFGASGGAAPKCVRCENGSVSPGNVASCSKCPAGQGPSADGSKCEMCPQGTFSDGPGVGCIECPHGTKPLALSGAQGCDDGDCQYRASDNALYDLRPLRRDKFYGPVVVDEHDYELSVCQNVHHNDSQCLDPNGEPIVAYACQVLESGIGLSLGSRIGYYDYNGTDGQRGITLEYTGGHFGCKGVATSFFDNSPGVHRSTNITFICDPSAGRGQPEPCQSKDFTFWSFLRGGVEPTPCHYCFEWRTVYGCPACTPDDYEQVYGECVAGRRQRLWRLKDGAQCNGGTPPPSDSVDCSSGDQIACPAGQFSTPGSKACTKCAKGKYSAGPDSVYYEFDSVVRQSFEATRDVTPWVFGTYAMRSGDADVSEVSLAALIFEPNGMVEFEYTVFGAGKLVLLVNGAESSVPLGLGGAAKQPVQKAARVTWRFVRDSTTTTTTNDAYAIVYNVRARNHRKSAAQCDACPLGTAASVEGSEQCVPCQANEYAANEDGSPAVSGGAVKCVECAPNKFAYAGSPQCYDKSAKCELGSDYVMRTTPCVGGKRVEYAAQLAPQRCVDDSAFKAISNKTIDCVASCADGMYRDESGACTAVPTGFVSVHTKSVFAPSDTNTVCQMVGPTGTQCSGWRQHGDNTFDSGDNGDGIIDNRLIIPWDGVGLNASMSFEVDFMRQHGGNGAGATDGASDITLYVYLNEQLVKTIDTAGAYKVLLDTSDSAAPTSQSVVQLRYHQEAMPAQSHDVHRGVVVKALQLTAGKGKCVGDATSVEKCGKGYTAKGCACVACPPGTASPDGVKCVACSPGFYSPVAGSECLKCGTGTSSKAGSSRCETTCVFAASGQMEMSMDGTMVEEKNSTIEEAAKTPRYFNLTHIFDNVYYVRASSQLEFQLSPCAASAQCEEGVSGHVIGSGTNSCSIVGHDLVYEPVDVYNLHKDQDVGFTLSFRAPKTSVCENPSATIQFVCDPDEGYGEPTLVRTSTVECQPHFVWHSQLGCPQCTSGDYTKPRGECVDGQRAITGVRQIECNGPPVKQFGHESCELEFTFPYWVLIAAAAVLMIVLICTCFTCFKNRRLQHRYSQLQHVSANETSMTLIDSDSDDNV